MNPTTPALNNAETGVEFRHQKPGQPAEVDRDSLELSCVDLIGKLENLVAKAKDKGSDDFIDDSGSIGRKMLSLLLEFSNEYLSGSAAEQAQEEINRGLTFSHTYDEVLKTRSIKDTIVRAFWNIEESSEIRESHSKLGDALTRGCAATFYHAVLLAGLETELGKQIDQSTVVFVNELQQSWK